MRNHFRIALVAIGCAAMFGSTVLAQEQASTTYFNKSVPIQTDQFPDYPCADAVGHAAKCDAPDMHGLCIDGSRKPVQCVQPIILNPAPPPPPLPGVPYSSQKGNPSRVYLAMPTQPAQPKTEIVLRDSATSTTVTVHDDHRHVSAVDMTGKQLWSRDPLADSGIDPYRFALPKIVSIVPVIDKSDQELCRKLSKSNIGRCLFIRYDSAQSGFINLATGKFYFWGQY